MLCLFKYTLCDNKQEESKKRGTKKRKTNSKDKIQQKKTRMKTMDRRKVEDGFFLSNFFLCVLLISITVKTTERERGKKNPNTRLQAIEIKRTDYMYAETKTREREREKRIDFNTSPVMTKTSLIRSILEMNFYSSIIEINRTMESLLAFTMIYQSRNSF